MPITIPDGAPEEQTGEKIFAGVHDDAGNTRFAPLRGENLTTINGIKTLALSVRDAALGYDFGTRADAQASNDAGTWSLMALTKRISGHLFGVNVKLGTANDWLSGIGGKTDAPASGSIGTWSGISLWKRSVAQGDSMLSRLSSIHGGVEALVSAQVEPLEGQRAYLVEATGNYVWHGSELAMMQRMHGIYEDESNELGGAWMGAFGSSLMAGPDLSNQTTLHSNRWDSGQKRILLLPIARFDRTVLHITNGLNVDLTVQIYLADWDGYAYHGEGIGYGNPSPEEGRYYETLVATRVILPNGGRNTFGSSATLSLAPGYVLIDEATAGWGYLRITMLPTTEGTPSNPTSGEVKVLAIRS